MEYAACQKCASCGASAHPASGCQYSETCLVCGRCTREAWRWIKGHTNTTKRVGKKGSKIQVSFYEAAGRNPPEPHTFTQAQCLDINKHDWLLHPPSRPSYKFGPFSLEWRPAAGCYRFGYKTHHLYLTKHSIIQTLCNRDTGVMWP